MSRASVLARGRAAAEAGMVDACTIRRRLDDTDAAETGEVTKHYLSPDPYTGKCRVQAARALAQEREAGEDFLLMLRLEVQLPVEQTAGLEVNDELTVTASVNDPDLVGRTFLVHDLFHKTEATSRRIQVTERTDS